MIEYLRKVYNVEPTKVNSLNHPGKLKRSMMRRGFKVYRTSPFKKFMVTVDPTATMGMLPEQLLNEPLESEVVGGRRSKRKD